MRAERLEGGSTPGPSPPDLVFKPKMPPDLAPRLPMLAPVVRQLPGGAAAWRWWLLFGVVPLLLVIAGWWIFLGHGAPFVEALFRLGPAPVAGALALVCMSLGMRVWRWQLILRSLGHQLPWRLQTRAYLAGLALSSTPGKLGEASRALLLHAHGVPTAHTLGAFVCDRLADVLAVSALGVVAAWLTGNRWVWLELLLFLSLVGGLALAVAWKLLLGRRFGDRFVIRGISDRWRARLNVVVSPLTAWAKAWAHWRILPWILMALVAYGVQALVFFIFVVELDAGVSWLRCVEIFSKSVLIGAASLVPGGLGAMDAALVWQLQSDGVPLQAAMVATLATRACTLWFAWMVGLLAWTSFGRGGGLQGPSRW